MARKTSKPKALSRFKVSAGTPHEMETSETAVPSSAKGWLEGRMRARKKWGDRYAWSVRDQMTPIMEALDNLDLREAKPGRSWEWRAHDEVSGVTFVYSLEVLT